MVPGLWSTGLGREVPYVPLSHLPARLAVDQHSREQLHRLASYLNLFMP